MNKRTYPSLQETRYEVQLPSGLQVYMVPKPGFHKTYVTLSTPLGSNTVTYKDNGVVKDIPAGMAHFLEHKLFEQDGFDVSETFALHGASVNAFTMNNKTTYLFSTANNLTTHLETLLQFVFNPSFTEAGVEKEKPIIEQEINMYADDSNTVIYMNVLQNMYHNHPVKEEILGTKESVYSITKQLLEDVHATYYHPKNMVLFITGNIDVDDVYQTLLTIDPVRTTTSKERFQPSVEERRSVVSSYQEIHMDVMVPNVLMGIKLEPHWTSIMKYELIGSIALDLLLGRSTKNYQKLLELKLINDTFGVDVSIDKDYGYLLIGSQTKQPRLFDETIKKMIKDLYTKGVDTIQYRRTKKLIVGNFIQALNSLEYIANQCTKYDFMDADLFTILDVAKTITIDDITSFIATIQSEELYTTSVVFPNKKDD